MEQENLVKRCQCGDFESFNDFNMMHRDNAMRIAYFISGKRGIAENIVQEAFTQCFKGIKTLKNPRSLIAGFIIYLSDRTVIVLYYYNELTIKEISKITGCFQGTVKSRLHIA